MSAARRRPWRLVFAWAPAALTMATIWILSSMPNPPVPVEVLPFRDRGAHFLAFGAMAFFVSHGTHATRPEVHGVRVVLFSILATGLWGLLDEVHQSFVPNRTPDLGDLVADTLGGIVGATLRSTIRALGFGSRAAKEATA